MPTPEQRLLVALIERAWLDLKERDHRKGARRWLESTDDGPFSFAFCCDYLDLDEETVRRRCLDR